MVTTNVFEEPSSDVLFYRQFRKRVYCSNRDSGNHCQNRVIGQVNYHVRSHLYVYHYCETHKQMAGIHVFEKEALHCECEYETHFLDEKVRDCHARSTLFVITELTSVKTDYGTFTVCDYCKTVHLKGFINSESPVTINY